MTDRAMTRFLFALFCAMAAPALAEDSALRGLMTGDDAAGWEAVGRIDIDGKGFCTGALIEPDLVLTAAHCLFDKTTGERIGAERIAFLAGFRNGRALAYRDVRVALPHPDFVLRIPADPDEVRNDLALLQLYRPIRIPSITPFELSQSRLPGSEVGVVSYGEGREEIPSLQETCEVLGHQDGVLIMSCEAGFGSSGAPVFRNENGVYRLVSVVSAMADLDGEKVSLGTDLAGPIEDLRAALQPGPGLFSTPLSDTRTLRPGESADIGARFVRP